MDPERIAALWAELMRGLGYARFGAQGGDWGAMVTTYLGCRHADAVAGIHLNMVVAFPPDPANPADGLTQEELIPLMQMQQFLKEETGYQHIQGTKPQTLGYALNDSPAGLAAWIVEKFRTWSDCDGDVERRFTQGRAADQRDALLGDGDRQLVVPALLRDDARGQVPAHGLPRRRADRLRDLPARDPQAAARVGRELYNVQRWTRCRAGGHFAAMEEPARLVDDVRAFFRPLRG